MGMQPKDLFWTISIPFRMYNTKELDLNTFIFTLSFDAALKNCDVSTARKVIMLALQKDLIERDPDKNTLRAKFELWEPKLLPPNWSPTFVNLEDIPPIDFIPLQSNIEYNPKPIERIKRPEPKEMDLFFKSRAPKVESVQEVETQEPTETVSAGLEEPTEKVNEKKRKISSKKKPAKKQEKPKGQKSIQDFFR